MSEEVKDASAAIPKAIITVYIINFILLFPAIVTVCYHTPDLSAALNDSTTYPAIYVLRQSMSTPCITALLVVICFITAVSNINYYAAVTRDLFAFARDQGLPFSKWLCKVDPMRRQPVNACRVSGVVAGLLSLIYIGSPVAFYAITSLATVSLLLCYCLSIGCILWRRINEPHTLPPAHFTLSKWAIPVNASAVLFCLWSFFWSFWPQSVPVTASGFNWASPIFITVIIVSLLYFAFRAKHKYVGPVTEVEGRRPNVRMT